jgi:uncharacterized protein YjbI with pentapeptide repeats
MDLKTATQEITGVVGNHLLTHATLNKFDVTYSAITLGITKSRVYEFIIYDSVINEGSLEYSDILGGSILAGKFINFNAKNSNFDNLLLNTSDLSGSTFYQCCLNSVKFKYCDLSGVTFIGCTLKDTSIKNCDIKGLRILSSEGEV